VAVLGSDPLVLAVRANSSVHTTAQLLSLLRHPSARPLLGVAQNTWLQGNLAALAQSADLQGQVPYSVYRTSREAVVSLDAGEVEVVVAPHSALRMELHSDRLRELPWPASLGAVPDAWLAIVAPAGLSSAELAALRSQAHHLCGGTWTEMLRSDGLSPVAPSRLQLEDFLHTDIDEANRLQILATRIVRNY
jgi:tripartite-type tricarboxylate transporter receptor subunit TctC